MVTCMYNLSSLYTWYMLQVSTVPKVVERTHMGGGSFTKSQQSHGQVNSKLENSG